MKLNDFARTILLGDRLEDKLVELNGEFSLESSGFEQSFAVPAFPGRPVHLSRPGKASFPALHLLHKSEVRGEVLHFFANHELLAMELMALVLLRFPDAPGDFRLGIARTIQEEQSHLRLYLLRMKELGISFGDLPVSEYFWKTMKKMRSPLDFVVQMSLTFEQANLDFSYFFMNAVRAHGDERTGEILERVYVEEIGHVKHGLSWFNRWRENAERETDWDAYVRLLPMPMTPRRAKGFNVSPGFFSEVRRRAGFSEKFIRELSLYSGSKGRPPVIWLYNPHCDSEIARGKPGFTPTEGAKRVSQDLECIPLFLANEQDTVLLQEKPDIEWLESLKEAGFRIPEFSSFIRAPKIGGIEPWGWSPDAFERFKGFKNRIVEMDGANGAWCTQLLDRDRFSDSELGVLFSKSWSSKFLKNWLHQHPNTQPIFVEIARSGDVLRDYARVKEKASDILHSGARVMLKAPYGTSGMQVRELKSLEELEGPTKGWVENILEAQGELIVEELLNKVADLSVQLEVGAGRTEIYESRRFFNGSRNEYRGTYLGKKQGALFQGSQEESKFLHEVQGAWQSLLRDIAQALRQAGYQGPAGVDALLWRDSERRLRMKPLVELNPRWTMGRVALELEKRLAPGVSGVWRFLSLKGIQAQGFSTAHEYSKCMREKYPLQMVRAGGGERIQKGLIFTNDPKRAKETLSVLATSECLFTEVT